jgi:hypothetical protein
MSEFGNFVITLIGIGNNPYYCWSVEEISGNKMERLANGGQRKGIFAWTKY